MEEKQTKLGTENKAYNADITQSQHVSDIRHSRMQAVNSLCIASSRILFCVIPHNTAI